MRVMTERTITAHTKVSDLQMNYKIPLNVVDVRILKIFEVNCFAVQNLCALLSISNAMICVCKYGVSSFILALIPAMSLE